MRAEKAFRHRRTGWAAACWRSSIGSVRVCVSILFPRNVYDGSSCTHALVVVAADDEAVAADGAAGELGASCADGIGRTAAVGVTRRARDLLESWVWWWASGTATATTSLDTGGGENDESNGLDELHVD